MIFTLKNQDEMMDVWKIKQWIETYKPKILGAEQTVYDFRLKEAGTIDAIFEFDNVELTKKITLDGVYIVDFKTGKGVYDTAKMQCASYRHMYQKMYNVKVAGVIILHTGAKTVRGIAGLSTIVLDSAECAKYFKLHVAASRMWFLNNPNFAPKVFNFPRTLALSGVECLTPRKDEIKP